VQLNFKRTEELLFAVEYSTKVDINIYHSLIMSYTLKEMRQERMDTTSRNGNHNLMWINS
jgi:hypothetical protein